MADVKVELGALTAHDVEKIRRWRNQTPEAWRTSFRLTAEQQQEFYRDIVCRRESSHRYWAVLNRLDVLVGMVGITDLEWENRLGQISLGTDPSKAGQGYGAAAVEAVLVEAFERMGLLTVYGECYGCNTRGLSFWRKMADWYKCATATLPGRKFWHGRLWDSFYFSFDAESFLNRKAST